MPDRSVVSRPRHRNLGQSALPVNSSFVCVVAIVGFAVRLPNGLRGTVNSCGWTAVQFANAEVAVSALRKTVRVDAIVIDSNAITSSQEGAVETLIAFARAAPWDDVPVPVIVVGRRRAPSLPDSNVRDVHLLTGPGTHYENLGRLVRELCHLPGTCCAPRTDG
jgi:hypothetical protein